LEKQKVDLAIAQATSVPVMAYSDGGMHPSFRAILEKNGAKKMAASVSKTKYPVSRPEAALADPFAGIRK
jgi:hypothetical protein